MPMLHTKDVHGLCSDTVTGLIFIEIHVYTSKQGQGMATRQQHIDIDIEHRRTNSLSCWTRYHAKTTSDEHYQCVCLFPEMEYSRNGVPRKMGVSISMNDSVNQQGHHRGCAAVLTAERPRIRI